MRREARPGLRPSDLIEDESTATSLDAAQRGFELGFACPEVEVVPASWLQRVVAKALPVAARTPLSAARGDLEDRRPATELVGLEPSLADRWPQETKAGTVLKSRRVSELLWGRLLRTSSFPEPMRFLTSCLDSGHRRRAARLNYAAAAPARTSGAPVLRRTAPTFRWGSMRSAVLSSACVLSRSGLRHQGTRGKMVCCDSRSYVVIWALGSVLCCVSLAGCASEPSEARGDPSSGPVSVAQVAGGSFFESAGLQIAARLQSKEWDIEKKSATHHVSFELAGLEASSDYERLWGCIKKQLPERLGSIVLLESRGAMRASSWVCGQVPRDYEMQSAGRGALVSDPQIRTRKKGHAIVSISIRGRSVCEMVCIDADSRTVMNSNVFVIYGP